ncbi:MAG TPA: HAD family phosphatase [Tepidisphaeraceae bacterium]|jgi:beta-phosphoglucomutase-like phosphatase (HAD superfamily)|nr:HAD family phosphatase [Tepidisphaeraceae bacterium]
MVSIQRFKAVIFDFDGVIIDSERVQLQAWNAVMAELGVKGEMTLGQIAGKLDRHIAPEFLPGHEVVRCVQRKNEIQTKLEASCGVICIEETLELVERMAGSHRLGICSSSGEGKIREVLRGRGVEGRFEVVVGQVAGEDCKPAPGPYLKVLRLMGLEAGEACVIEDSPTGIAAAKGAGLFVIQLLHEGMTVNPGANAVVRSAKEVGS